MSLGPTRVEDCVRVLVLGDGAIYVYIGETKIIYCDRSQKMFSICAHLIRKWQFIKDSENSKN